MDVIARLLQAHAMVAADPDEAASICREVAAVEPDNGFALHLLGVLRLQRGAAAEARDALRRAVAARPDSQETRLALAEACVACGDADSAAAALGAVLAAWPGHAPALGALSAVRLRQGDVAAALALAEQARAAAPESIEPLVALGTALSAARRWQEARLLLTEAVARDPCHGHAHLNLGNVLLDLNEEDAAERHMRHAVGLLPGTPEAWASLGFLLAGTDRLNEAIAACDRAIALRPDFAQAYWNRGFAALRAGDFARGWADYEWRWRHPDFAAAAHVLPGPEWNGGDIAGRRLLVNATQGLGDTIQLARYLPLLVARGGTVTLRCDERLFGLLAQTGVALARRGDPLPEYDLWIDQMSLPGRFATTLATIPAAGGYLRADPVPMPGGRPRVGLVCAGNPAHSNDFRRSMRPDDMRPLRRVEGVNFVSLQVGPVAAELAAAFGLADHSALLADMARTARIVAGLDLVITVDTAVAHLAGALGRPVWILIPRAPDWRWPAGRTDSPWHASARLFRQRRAGDWAGVIAEVTEALARVASGAEVLGDLAGQMLA